MAAPQAQHPRQQLMTTLLLFAVVFLGMQLLFPPQQPDTRSAGEILGRMQDLAAEGKDVSLAKELPAYTRAVEKLKSDGTIDQAELDKRVLAAHTLAAHTKLKAGLYWDKVKGDQAGAQQKIMAGYTLLQPKYTAFHDSPLWESPVPVTPQLTLTETSVTPGALYGTLVDDLKVRNKSQLVFYLFPGWYLIDFLVQLTGAVPSFSYWFAALLLAIVVRAAVLPLSNKQMMHGRKMMQLQPYTKEIQEKFKDKKTGQIPMERQQAAQAEMMALYKEYGLNPLAGCGTAAVQIPFFLGIYQCMLLYKFEFTAGTFLWIRPGAHNFLGMQLAPNLGQVDHPMIILYALTMLASTMMMPVSDPATQRQQRMLGILMPIIVGVGMFFFPIPSAFVLYWVFTNILTMIQSLVIYRIPLEPLQKVATATGGVIPVQATPKNGKSNGHVDAGFFGKTGGPRKSRKKK
ncbi:MAG: membrane protein insertase YidC [Fimbriimonadaceae bacterium]|nr:membrane protein insertase YidC [Fimbriimonadaceae bacterium]QYK56070.1 MAG: membrane protein insertase YidC [Fimbriimonadaceae bacterium]